MAKTRREFTPEFRREAVALPESSGRSRMQIAAEPGIQRIRPAEAAGTITWLCGCGAELGGSSAPVPRQHLVEA